MIRAVHLSDLHITEGPRLADQAAILDRIAAEPDVDVWLVTGDLTGRTVPHRATPAERLVLYRALAAMGASGPVVVIPGNHDEARDLLAAAHVGTSIPGDGCWPVHVLDGAGSTTIETPSGPLRVYHLAYPTKRWLLAGRESAGLRQSQAAVEARLVELFDVWALQEATADRSVPSVLAAHAAVVGASTSGGEVLATQEIAVPRAAIERLMAAGVSYGALGHLHLRQEVAPRAWYVGSPWRTDFGEREPCKVVHHVELRDATCDVEARETGCPWFETLDYRWSAAGEAEDGLPGWSARPTDEQFARIRGAEVRARLTVPQQHAASAPWQAELDRLAALGALRVTSERIVEPVLRVRAPEVAQAVGLPDKLAAYWSTLGTEVPDADRAVALELLGRLDLSDEDIAALDV